MPPAGTSLPFSAAADRNKDPILAVLESLLPREGKVLEIASGTGQHICHFAQALPRIRWQPSEPDVTQHEVITARIGESGLLNVDPPIALDVMQARWPVADLYDAVICINMIHISPWAATGELMRGAARHLAAQGKLVTYGPYLEGGTAAPSNLDFDASLKRRDAAWGLRDIEEVTRVAATHGLHRQQVLRMPANNLTVVFAKT